MNITVIIIMVLLYADVRRLAVKLTKQATSNDNIVLQRLDRHSDAIKIFEEHQAAAQEIHDIIGLTEDHSFEELQELAQLCRQTAAVLKRRRGNKNGRGSGE